jgi:hypothetical protein
VTDATLYTSINPFDVLNRVESKKDSGKSKIKVAIAASEAVKVEVSTEGYVFLIKISVKMFDKSPWTRSPEIQAREARKYHDRLAELSEIELAVFVDDLLKFDDSDDLLVEKVETFMTCLLPFDCGVLKAHIEKLDTFSVYIHIAMCCLKTVAGKTDSGSSIGEDCSYFGRFHGRLEEYLFGCMLCIV